VKRRYVLGFFQNLPPCLIGIEACASSHHWSRELQALGHTVRLMPPAYVKPYVKRQKNDAADAEAICEAVRRPTMRFVEVANLEKEVATLKAWDADKKRYKLTELRPGVTAYMLKEGMEDGEPMGKDAITSFRPASRLRKLNKPMLACIGQYHLLRFIKAFPLRPVQPVSPFRT
jgi:hypothetical protein